MSLRDLYQDMILDHGKSPRNFGNLAGPTHWQLGHNPLCGDQIKLYLVKHNNVVDDVRFEGSGCAISVASASLMTEAIKGKKLADIEKLFEHFHCLVTEGGAPSEALGKLAIFSGVAAFPARVKCATLAWHTLKAALADKKGTTSTE